MFFFLCIFLAPLVNSELAPERKHLPSLSSCLVLEEKKCSLVLLSHWLVLPYSGHNFSIILALQSAWHLDADFCFGMKIIASEFNSCQFIFQCVWVLNSIISSKAQSSEVDSTSHQTTSSRYTSLSSSVKWSVIQTLNSNVMRYP